MQTQSRATDAHSRKQQWVIATKLATVGRAPSFDKARRMIDNLSTFTIRKRHHETGPALVDMTYEEASKTVESKDTDIIVTPLVKYYIALAPIFPPHLQLNMAVKGSNMMPTSPGGRMVRFHVLDHNGVPLANAAVSAIFNLQMRLGVSGTTDYQGRLILDLPANVPNMFEVVYVYPEHSFWPIRKKAVAVEDNEIRLTPLPDISEQQWWQEIINTAEANPNNLGKGVKVAVVDTGIGPHADLPNVVDGRNITVDGGSGDYRDVNGHGSHVAGIIGAQGRLRGIAPSAELYAARVFPRNDEGADNMDISEAITTAVDDWGCDIINLSLGGPYDPIVEDRINYATNKGVICIAAAGNSNGPVEFPGALNNSYSVSAIGQLQRYPEESIHTEAEPVFPGYYGRLNLYAAGFSCKGEGVDACAPGVGIISCFLGNKYAALDGTSMACPIVTGLAALSISDDKHFSQYQGTKRKADLIRTHLNSNLADIRLPKDVQGSGFAQFKAII